VKRFIYIYAALAALALAGCGSSQDAVSDPDEPAKLVLGYYTGDSASSSSAKSTHTPVNAVSQDVIDVDADGDLHGNVAANLVKVDAGQRKLTFLNISNFGAVDFDPVIAHGAMVTHRAHTIDNIVALAEVADVSGIDIDFEGIYPTDRDGYSTFVAELADALHTQGSMLLLSVPAKTSDDPSDDWSWPYDYARLDKSADFIQVMTYDEHVPGQPPGPVAGIDWMKACLKYAVSRIDKGKVLLGLPAYGYDWDLTDSTGVQVDWKDSAALVAATGAVPQRDAASESEHFQYTAGDGSMHEVWYEDAQGIQDKTHLAVTLDLGGVSMWALGFEDDDFWDAVEAGLQ